MQKNSLELPQKAVNSTFEVIISNFAHCVLLL